MKRIERKGFLWLVWPVLSTGLFVLMFRSESGLALHNSWRATTALAAIFFLGQAALGLWLFWARSQHPAAPLSSHGSSRVVDITTYQRHKSQNSSDSSRP